VRFAEKVRPKPRSAIRMAALRGADINQSYAK
jgi:hypothetical protein